MKKRSECDCPCHEPGAVVFHVVQCCEDDTQWVFDNPVSQALIKSPEAMDVITRELVGAILLRWTKCSHGVNTEVNACWQCDDLAREPSALATTTHHSLLGLSNDTLRTGFTATARTCGNCKYRGEQQTIPYDDATDTWDKPTTYFACDLIKHGNDRDKYLLPGKGAVAIDGSGYYAALCVEEDFGCNKWEPKI